MLRESFKIEQGMRKRLAFALLLCFIVGSLLSAAVSITHNNHEHDHNGPDDGCAVCAMIHIAEFLLASLKMASKGAAFWPVDLSTAIAPGLAGAFSVLCITLVRLKIRIDN